MDLLSFRHSVATVGWAVTVPIIDATEVSELRACVTAHARSGRGGARNLLDDPQIASLAAAPVLRQFADVVLGKACFAVRAIFFDKTRDANWKVIWHQDLTVAVQQRIDLLGYGPWTDKAGVPHVQPPVDILEHMLAIRIHLDPCGDDNGPVRVLDGTHRLGRLTPQAIDELRHNAQNRFVSRTRGRSSPFTRSFSTPRAQPPAPNTGASFTSSTPCERSLRRSSGIVRLPNL